MGKHQASCCAWLRSENVPSSCTLFHHKRGLTPLVVDHICGCSARKGECCSSFGSVSFTARVHFSNRQWNCGRDKLQWMKLFGIWSFVKTTSVLLHWKVSHYDCHVQIKAPRRGLFQLCFLRYMDLQICFGALSLSVESFLHFHRGVWRYHHDIKMPGTSHVHLGRNNCITCPLSCSGRLPSCDA